MANNSAKTGKLRKGKLEFRNIQAKDIRILTKEWPANIFAKSLIPKLTALAIKDTSYIKIIKGAMTVGVTVG